MKLKCVTVTLKMKMITGQCSIHRRTGSIGWILMANTNVQVDRFDCWVQRQFRRNALINKCNVVTPNKLPISRAQRQHKRSFLYKIGDELYTTHEKNDFLPTRFSSRKCILHVKCLRIRCFRNYGKVTLLLLNLPLLFDIHLFHFPRKNWEKYYLTDWPTVFYP